MSEDRIRIAYCIDNMNVGGTELNAVRTAERLDRSRFDLRVICLQGQGPLLARYEEAGIPVHSLPIRNLYGPGAWRQGRRLMALLREHRVEVLHAHDMYSNVFAVFWARLAGVRTIASRRWWEGSPGLHWRVASAAGHRLAHRTLANAPRIARLLEREGVAPERISVVPNFLDESAFDLISAEERDRLLVELGARPDARTVGVLANLHPVKDHGSLIEAAALLAGRYPGLQLLFVGDGSMREPLAALARERGMIDRVVFAGRRTNVPNLHQLFEISVLSSYSEGFPNSILEAMAAARPVVATSVGAIPDAVVDGTTGLLVPPRSPDRLAVALDTLLSDPATAHRMGSSGRERARAHFSADVALSALERLYHELVAPKAMTRAAPTSSLTEY